jgi:hypothetical protein
MSNGQVLNNQYEFFEYHNTTRYEWFKDLQPTYPEVYNEYTFYKNTNDARIFDMRTFYQYGASYLTPSVTPTPTPTPTATGTPTPTATPTPTPTVSGDADAIAYLASVTATGGTVNGTITSAVNTLFVDLKAAGIYSKLDVLMPMIGGTKPSMIINAKYPTNSSWLWTEYGASLTFSSSGIACNGTGALKSNFTLNLGTNTVQGDSHFGIYYNNVVSGAYFSGFLNTNESPYGYFNVASWNGSLYGGQYGGGGVFNASDTAAVGWWFAQRTAIDNATWSRNNSTVQTATDTVTYGPSDYTQPIALFALGWDTFNEDGLYTEGVNGSMCTVTVGASLTTQQKTDLYNIVTAFNTALSRN